MTYYGDPSDIAVMAAKRNRICCYLVKDDRVCGKTPVVAFDNGGYCYCNVHRPNRDRCTLQQVTSGKGG